MSSLYITALRFQMALIETTVALTRVMSENYLRLLDQQRAVLHQPAIHRDDDEVGGALVNPIARKRKKRGRRARAVTSPCCGAELDDHYGKRAHDVDVERI